MEDLDFVTELVMEPAGYGVQKHNAAVPNAVLADAVVQVERLVAVAA